MMGSAAGENAWSLESEFPGKNHTDPKERAREEGIQAGLKKTLSDEFAEEAEAEGMGNKSESMYAFTFSMIQLLSMMLLPCGGLAFLVYMWYDRYLSMYFEDPPMPAGKAEEMKVHREVPTKKDGTGETAPLKEASDDYTALMSDAEGDEMRRF